MLAAQRCTADEIASLAQIVAEMRRNLHDPDAYVELDIAFHIQIAAMTRNEAEMKQLAEEMTRSVNENGVKMIALGALAAQVALTGRVCG